MFLLCLYGVCLSRRHQARVAYFHYRYYSVVQKNQIRVIFSNNFNKPRQILIILAQRIAIQSSPVDTWYTLRYFLKRRTSWQSSVLSIGVASHKFTTFWLRRSAIVGIFTTLCIYALSSQESVMKCNKRTESASFWIEWILQNVCHHPVF